MRLSSLNKVATELTEHRVLDKRVKQVRLIKMVTIKWRGARQS